jgi:hypothetical protein
MIIRIIAKIAQSVKKRVSSKMFDVVQDEIERLFN